MAPNDFRDEESKLVNLFNQRRVHVRRRTIGFDKPNSGTGVGFNNNFGNLLLNDKFETKNKSSKLSTHDRTVSKESRKGTSEVSKVVSNDSTTTSQVSRGFKSPIQI
ncbi:acyl-CoA dehydrogenase [Sesbania bispinosa]|nr:acyl-CoA dehydrogenase [Sesbania bispinosa]